MLVYSERMEELRRVGGDSKDLSESPESVPMPANSELTFESQARKGLMLDDELLVF